MTIGKRIRMFRGGLSVVNFARVIGISQGSLSDIENEKTTPSANTLAALVRNTDINPLWLFIGEGPMRREEAVGAATLGGTVAVRSGTERDYVEKLLKILRSGDDLIISAIIPNLEAFSARLVEKAEEPVKKKKGA